MNLSGKRALITGGRRLGGLLAVELARRGCHIALSYHSQREPVERTAAACRALGVRSLIHQADLREPAAARGLIEAVVAPWGGIDLLINLTSIYRRTPLVGLTDQDSRELLASNLEAPYWVAVAAAQQMLTQPIVEGLRGKMLHFTDWAVDRPYPYFLPYMVAKGAVVTLTKALAVELAPTITVNAIAPGTVEPPPHLTPDDLARLRSAAALERIGHPDDVIRAALYLLEGTDFVTGEVYRVDGGRFLGPVRENGDEGRSPKA